MRHSKVLMTVVAAAVALLASVALAPPGVADGATHVSGTGTLAEGDECTGDAPYYGDNAPAGVTPLLFTGDLVGCYYTDTSSPKVTPMGGGTYRLVDHGTETFIGEMEGRDLSFRSRYVVLATFQGNPLTDPDARLLSGQCFHPLIEGGHGLLHFVDDVDTGLIHYSGRILV